MPVPTGPTPLQIDDACLELVVQVVTCHQRDAWRLGSGLSGLSAQRSARIHRVTYHKPVFFLVDLGA